jgi:hypothetical protein
MLKALLHRKLGRVAFGAADEGDGDAEGTTPDGLTGLEDPLTSTVFERLAYLPPDVAWDILRRASEPLGGGPAMPGVPPEGTPSWSFWPGLRPGAQAHNTVRVEPDVLVTWGDTRLLIEAKHRCFQDPGQWIEQIRALRGAPAHAGKQTWLLAVGGIVKQEAQAHLARVHRELAGEVPGLLTIRWECLREVLYSLDGPALPSGPSAVVRDMAAALEEWGYRRKTWFSSLPAVAARLRGEEALSALQSWRVR